MALGHALVGAAKASVPYITKAATVVAGIAAMGVLLPVAEAIGKRLAAKIYPDPNAPKAASAARVPPQPKRPVAETTPPDGQRPNGSYPPSA